MLFQARSADLVTSLSRSSSGGSGSSGGGGGDATPGAASEDDTGANDMYYSWLATV